MLLGTYILLSVGLGLPIFGVLADLIISILVASGVQIPNKDILISYTTQRVHLLDMYDGVDVMWWSVIGLVVQFLDAIWYIYLGFLITRGCRLVRGRPMWARLGKRSLVIVDIPWVHQLMEIYVSKLFSLSYGFVGIDVHGANGLDHFVHRFTHRVARGVLLAVGRPDGRLCCLAKSEAAVILACKQAAFIQNPAYEGEGSGPDIVTIGHNPHQSNMGLCSDITLRSQTRGKFIDELLYERLFLATKPFASAILRNLVKKINSNTKKKSSEAVVNTSLGPLKRICINDGSMQVCCSQSTLN